MVNEQRIVDEFIELVKVDSETKNEKEISLVLKEKFTALGCEVQEDDAASTTEHAAGNLIVTLKGSKQTGPVLYFTSHMDTVYREKASNHSWKKATLRRTERLFSGQMTKQVLQLCSKRSAS